MSDTPHNMSRDNATGTSQSGDLSGISEMFGLRDGEPAADTGARTGTDTVGRWVAATEGADQPPDVSSRLIHGRYRLIAELGVGGMGVTYRAWDTKAGIPVVVKMPRREVRSDGEAMQRFAREIDAMLAVPDENVVPITDHGDDDGCPFVVMRFLPGGSLADYRRRDESGNALRNPPGMLHLWLPGVAAALDHIHSKGMLHRDVKPGNVFLDGFLRPFLGDFGIAKVVDESGGLNKEQTLTATKMAVGTPEYMAPELFKPRSKPDGRVDQYALAVTVYEMLSGEKPFKGDRAHIIVEHSAMPVPPLSGKVPGLPQSLCMAVEKGLAKKSEDRFSTCREFAEAVLADLAVLPPEADTVRLLCPSCKNILKLPQRAAGRTGKCPRCQTAMDVAADLGSLWLESEERGGGLSATEGTATPSQPLLEDSDEPQLALRKTTWRAVHWAAVVAVAAGSLVAGNFWGSDHERNRLGRQHTEELRRLQESRQLDIQEIHRSRGDSARAEQLLSEAEGKVKDLEKRVQDRDKTIADLETINAERDSISADNRRLEKELATAKAAIALKTLPAPSASETSRPVPVAPPGIETLINSIGIRFNLCPSGTFWMGDANGYDNEKPPRRIAITNSFYMGIYEVSNVEWNRVMGDVPSRWKEDDRPVDNVSWQDAALFCAKLSALPEELKAGRVYRLPTEAEWEYACRAGTTTQYSFGDDDSLLVQYGWFVKNSDRATHPVGQKKPNAWGLYDMHGNVWEWVNDWYGEGYYANSLGSDPQGPPSGGGRCERGGSWYDTARLCRSAERSARGPSSRGDYRGFRIALSPPRGESPEAAVGR